MHQKTHNEKQKEIAMSITLVQKNKSKGILTWYARVPDQAKKGTVHFFSLGTSARSEAKIILQQKIRDGSFDSRISPSQTTLGEAVERYEKFQRSKGIKKNSISMMLFALKSIEPLFDKPVAKISKKELSETFLSKNEHVGPTTYNNNKTVVSMLFQYIVDVLEIIPSNPIPKAIPKRKKVKPERHFWTTDQIDKLISLAPTPNSRLLWSLMAFAGLRKTEAISMKPEMIHGGLIHVIGKGDKAATIPICPRLQREIDRYDGDWDLAYAASTLERTAKKAFPEGFPGRAHAHRFRHSFGSNLIRAGVNVKIVQKLMRHENITMTLDIYGHILDTDAEDAISKVFK